jgi:hypothetical protein
VRKLRGRGEGENSEGDRKEKSQIKTRWKMNNKGREIEIME